MPTPPRVESLAGTATKLSKVDNHTQSLPCNEIKSNPSPSTHRSGKPLTIPKRQSREPLSTAQPARSQKLPRQTVPRGGQLIVQGSNRSIPSIQENTKVYKIKEGMPTPPRVESLAYMATRSQQVNSINHKNGIRGTQRQLLSTGTQVRND